MKVISYDRYGDLDVLHATEHASPEPRKGEVVVAMRATSVNVIDGRVRAGTMGPLVPNTFPKIPGADVAGVVTILGSDVTAFKPGDEVLGAVSPFSGGAFAEYVRVPTKQLALKPAELSFEEAGALPITGLAALQALRDLGKVGRGSRVLVHGASGGVGLFAVQIAKQMGAHVTAVAGPQAIETVTSLGADIAIDYAKRAIGKSDGPFDFILDASGKADWAHAHELLSEKGVLGELSPTIPAFIGSKLANLTRTQRHEMVTASPNTKDLAELAQLAARGQLKIVIAARYDFAHAIQALIDQERETTLGKRVVMIG